MCELPPYLDHLTAEERERASAIRKLNDAMRRAGPGAGLGDWYITAGVRDCGAMFAAIATVAVTGFNRFDEGNDPHGEHDFGKITLWKRRIFWKVDYYDIDGVYGSPDPADATITRRVLTIMLAEEW